MCSMFWYGLLLGAIHVPAFFNSKFRTSPPPNHPTYFLQTDTMSLAPELVAKLRELGLPEKYDAILLEEGTELQIQS